MVVTSCDTVAADADAACQMPPTIMTTTSRLKRNMTTSPLAFVPAAPASCARTAESLRRPATTSSEAATPRPAGCVGPGGGSKVGVDEAQAHADRDRVREVARAQLRLKR